MLEELTGRKQSRTLGDEKIRVALGTLRTTKVVVEESELCVRCDSGERGWGREMSVSE